MSRVKVQVEEVAMIGKLFSRMAAMLLCACLRALSKKPLAISGSGGVSDPLDLETARCRQNSSIAPAAAEGGLSHPIGKLFSRMAAMLLCACLRALSKKPLAISGTPQHFSPSPG
jgi:hypothetical protein